MSNVPIWWGNKYVKEDFFKMQKKENQGKEYAGRFFSYSQNDKFPQLTFAIEFNEDKTGIKKIIPEFKKV